MPACTTSRWSITATSAVAGEPVQADPGALVRITDVGARRLIRDRTRCHLCLFRAAGKDRIEVGGDQGDLVV
jgi:hypothetical protein